VGLVREYWWASSPEWTLAECTAGTHDDSWRAEYSVGKPEFEWTSIDGPSLTWTFAPLFACVIAPWMTSALWLVTLARPPPAEADHRHIAARFRETNNGRAPRTIRQADPIRRFRSPAAR